MDVRIGVSQSAKELAVELDDDASPDDVKSSVAKALTKGEVLWLTDRKGRQFGIPAEKIAYIEVGTAADGRRIGFGQS